MKVLENEIINNVINNDLFRNTDGLQLNYKFLNIFNSEVNIFSIGLNANINIIKNNNDKNNNKDYKNEKNENIEK